MKNLFIVIIPLLMSLISCDSSSNSSSDVSTRFGLSGLTQNYDPSEEKWRELLDGAKEAQVTMLHLQAPPWAEAEIAPGVYDLSYFEAFLRLNSEYGFQYSLDISTPLGLDMVNIPSDLSFQTFDDPQLVTRYLAFVSAVLNHLRDATHIILHSETAGTYFENDSMLQDFISYSNLISTTADHIRATQPGIQVGIYGTKNENAAILKVLNESTDFFGISYVADRGDADHQTILNQLASLADGKPIALFEVGVPTAERIGGSEEVQAGFIRSVFEFATQKSVNLVFLSFYQYADEDRAITEQYVPVLFPGLSNEQQLDLIAFISSLGLKNSDLSDKAGWAVFKDMISQ